MEGTEEVEFTTLMRRKTRQIHNLSDSLVQSKFVLGKSANEKFKQTTFQVHISITFLICSIPLGLIDDRVWAEGLLVFYEVFKFLEKSMENTRYTNVVKFFHPDLARTPYFETDLEFYYGPKWKEDYPPRECVRNYISHLEEISESDPNLLIPYIYHLYLGLLSGGRILRRKQKMMAFSRYSRVSSVVDFDNEIASYLKKFIKETMNEIASNMSDQIKSKLLEESITVFKLNCELIRSVNSANNVVRRLIQIFGYVGVAVVTAVSTYWYFNSGEENIDDK